MMFNKIRTAIVAVASNPVAVVKDAMESAAKAIEATLDGTFLGEFIMSESGRVNPEQGFRLAWGAGVIVAAMVVLGTPPQAAAHHCKNYSYLYCDSTAQCQAWCRVAKGCWGGSCTTHCAEHTECRCS